MRSNNGNKVPNQFIITDRGFVYLQSYNSIVARIKGDRVVLDRDKWDYSVTTLRYLNIFLGGQTAKETRAMIKNGTIKLANLNK